MKISIGNGFLVKASSDFRDSFPSNEKEQDSTMIINIMMKDLLKILIVFERSGCNLSSLLFDGSQDADEYFQFFTHQMVEIMDPHDTMSTFQSIYDTLKDPRLKQYSSLLKKVLLSLKPSDISDAKNSQFVRMLTLCKELPSVVTLLFDIIQKKENAIPLDILALLDQCGFLWGQSRSYMDYSLFIIRQLRLLLKFEHTYKRSYSKDKDSSLIPCEHLLEQGIQEKLSKFFGIHHCLWVTGLYSSTSLPLSSGGVSISIENFGVFIQLHTLLKHKPKYYSLNREELILHELIHACRENIQSTRFEEEFAYSLSPSFLRKLLAPITRGTKESLLFYVLSIVSVASDLPNFPRWFSLSSKLPFLWIILFGVIRLVKTKRILAHAREFISRALSTQQPNTISCLLLRITDEEIEHFSHLMRQVQHSSKESHLKIFHEIVQHYICDESDFSRNMRWKVIQHMFLRNHFRTSKL
ncbi:hypothetical protein C9374_003073 [Naegleria lovaniensis]|uniref:Uncharacterized protein n=1 Tax=Naegleria lovaniensis TaxID=51637 RepID=A0AA88GUC6_NAELO|nr:uncharacterized protein C9374_003073 [Naegleria lovaniensis]KAG2385924.1 hypothetical protein C9374_003073 [Naegleria lovaniensis]